MKKIKKAFVMILTSALLVGSVLSADAATYSLTRTCLAGCGQANTHTSKVSSYCKTCDKDTTIFTFVCSRCNTVYKVCNLGHYQ